VAQTCEYCGRACSDDLGGLPEGVSEKDRFAWPPADPQPGSTTSYPLSDSPEGLPALELNSSFPFSEIPDEPLHSQPGPEPVPAAEDPFLRDEEPQLLAPVALESTPHATAGAADASTAPPSSAGAKKSVGPRQIVVGGVLIAASALIFTILSMRPSASPEAVAQAGAQAGAPAPAGRPAANRAPSAASRTSAAGSATVTPKWRQVTGGRWTGGNKKSVAFELTANNRIHIWTRDVTPLLIVRCHGGQVEPFVYTQSAARMEPQDGDHTVRVAFDDGPEVTERWPDSDEHDALFAKDSAAFAQQLAAAQTLRFGFEPHNAPPASARFDVSGINELLSASAKPCGWKH
jgi:hypothetical protein